MTNKEHREHIGAKIKFFRELKGWTQEDLANKSGLMQQNIPRIEKGKINSGIDTLHKISTALGVKITIS